MRASSERILVVDDEAASREGMCALLQDEGYAVGTACDGAEALGLIRENSFDLVISDVQMPGMNGFDMVRRLRRTAGLRDLPIILVSGIGDSDRRTTGLHLGADDFMSKPVDFDELLARINTQLRHLRRSRELLKQVVRDELTGALNRRGILEVLNTTLRQAEREQTDTSVLMIDLNEFKAINDTRGHAAGDQVLRDVATALRSSVRAHDRVGRVGGDEFLVVLTNSGRVEAEALAERLRHCTPAASLAIGVATAKGAELPDVLIRWADKAMYEDKGARSRNSMSLHV